MSSIIIKEKTFEKAKKAIEKARKEKLPVIFSSEDDELNRKILEKEKIDIFLINLSDKKDRQKQRDSGLNQILAKIAKKQDVTIGINLDELIESSTKEKSQILARIRQNIKLCNKAKLKMKFLSPSQKPENQRNIYDLKSLGLVLGIPTNIVKNL